jgi:hypothetical protein
MSEDETFAAVSIATGNPVVETVDAVTISTLTADNINAGIPSVGDSVFGQTQTFEPPALETSAPTLGSPNIDIEHILGADDCEANAPVCGIAVIDVTRDLTADNILAGQPSVPDIPYGAAFLRYVQIEAISSNQVEITSYNQAV